jgi:hypothetical protein
MIKKKKSSCQANQQKQRVLITKQENLTRRSKVQQKGREWMLENEKRFEIEAHNLTDIQKMKHERHASP